MKRVIVNFVYLWILLIGGSQLIHAYILPKTLVESPSWDLVKKHQVKYKTLESNNVLIEEADVDLDEDLHSDNLNKGNSNKTLVANKNVLANMYLTSSSQLHYKDNSKQFNFFAPYYGHYNPIYLEIGVFRI